MQLLCLLQFQTRRSDLLKGYDNGSKPSAELTGPAHLCNKWCQSKTDLHRVFFDLRCQSNRYFIHSLRSVTATRSMYLPMNQWWCLSFRLWRSIRTILSLFAAVKYYNEPRPRRTDVDDSYNWSAPKYKKWCACGALLTLSLAYFAPVPQQSYHKKGSGAIITNIGDNDGWYRLEQGYKIEVSAHWWCDGFWLVNGKELTESSVLQWQE